MDKTAWVLAILGGIGITFLGAIFGGTILWFIWPALAKAFPGLVTQGLISSSLGWWDSVCLTWIFGILIKSSNTNNK